MTFVANLASASSEIGEIGQMRESGCSDIASSERRNLARSSVSHFPTSCDDYVRAKNNSCVVEFRDLDGLLRSDLCTTAVTLHQTPS